MLVLLVQTASFEAYGKRVRSCDSRINATPPSPKPLIYNVPRRKYGISATVIFIQPK